MPWVVWVVLIGAVTLRASAGLLMLWDRRGPAASPALPARTGTPTNDGLMLSTGGYATLTGGYYSETHHDMQ